MSSRKASSVGELRSANHMAGRSFQTRALDAHPGWADTSKERLSAKLRRIATSCGVNGRLATRIRAFQAER